ncbi:MAG: metallophosphoesterase [Gammaproteobacteria bacterium]
MDPALAEALEARLGRVHLRQRLGIESDHEAQVFGQGRNFFHIENWYSVHTLIRNGLRATLLYRRGRRNARDIGLRRNELRVAGLPRPFDGFTLLHVSDLHLDMSSDLPDALIRVVRGLDYDLCVMTGDFRARTFGPYAAALAGLARVREVLNGPVYGVLGNHDTIRMVPEMERLGVRLLMNESVALARGGSTIHLLGIDDPHYYRADNLEKALADVPPDRVSLLLAHSPEIYRHAAHAGIDVMLCGHTHGGQICLPGGRPMMCNARCPRSLCAGAWRFHDLLGYTSAGSGVSVVDVRLNCPPEVALHTLRAV